MAATSQLIEREIPRLRRYARALLRDRDGADDLVQDTILRALEKIHLWQPDTNLRAWLFTLMHNQYVNSVRQSVRQGHKVDLDHARLVTPAAQLKSLELRSLERAIARLPDEQRIVLLLVGLEAMKYEEVAEVCDVPVGTVRSRLSRAREALRRTLEGEEKQFADLAPADQPRGASQSAPAKAPISAPLLRASP